MAKAKRIQPLAAPDLSTRFRAYARDHLRGLFFSLGKLYRQPFATTLTMLMIAIALALPACLYVVLNNLQNVTQHWNDAGQITLFLKSRVNEKQLNNLSLLLNDAAEVNSFDYKSADQALKEFRQRDEFAELLEGLSENPLPATIVITPNAYAKNTDNLNSLVQILENHPHVDYVQLDITWLQRIQAITNIIQRAVIIVGMMLAISVLLVVGNSIRSDIENRREEIEVTKLIGATDRFIRRPFLYGGMWFGLVGGVLALALVLIVLLIVKHPAQELTRLYNSNFELMFPSFTQSVGLVVTSVCLGLLGAWLAVSRHISKIEPS